MIAPLKKAFLTIACILLISFCVPSIAPVEAQGSIEISINADGTVTPASAPIQKAGNYYTLTSDVTGSFTILRSNLTFDGNNHVITVPSIFSGGIELNDVSGVIVKNFVINGGAFGVLVWGDYNLVTNSTITGTDNGIYALNSPTEAIGITGSQNNVTNNFLDRNRVGINFMGGMPEVCADNFIVGNTMMNCSVALLIYDSSNNHIYYNNFVDNERIVEDTGYSGYGIISINSWDDDHHLGNYWSDYKTRYPNATTKGASELGDTPYFVRPASYVDPSTISRSQAKEYWINFNALYAKNVDNYPLMTPFTNLLYAQATTPPVINLTSPSNQVYCTTNVSLTLTTDKSLDWIGYSLDDAANVTATGNFVISNLTEGSHSITVYANDTYGNMVSESAKFTVSTSQPFSTLAMTALIITISVGVTLAIFFGKKKRFFMRRK